MKNVKGFTLAEVLITLGIIGVIAAITIPALINNINNMHYKTAYKKAFTDISQAFEEAMSDNSLTPRTTQFDSTATQSEWTAMKNKFKVTVDCDSPSKLYTCWANGDVVNVTAGACPNIAWSVSFIDNSGRSWATYYNAENIYLVDTNGLAGPNQFGKDRWLFTLLNADGTRVSVGLPTKVGILLKNDAQTKGDWCQYPPCYYYSWLYK